MPAKEKYNISYQPLSYWGLPESELSKIKGTIRQLKAADSAVDTGVEYLPVNISKSAMSDAIRDLIGRYDPQLMGGEYLPDYEEGEVEIARIVLDNNTLDTWSIRAKKEQDHIKYNVVDEYETIYNFNPTETTEPLTFEMLISLLDSIRDYTNPDAGLTNPYRDFNLHTVDHPEEELEFVTVYSFFYTELTNWYRDEASEWLEYMKSKYPNSPKA